MRPESPKIIGLLAQAGVRSVRDGLRWHQIEIAPGVYDWTSFLPMLDASLSAGTQVIGDLGAYPWAWISALKSLCPVLLLLPLRRGDCVGPKLCDPSSIPSTRSRSGPCQRDLVLCLGSEGGCKPCSSACCELFRRERSQGSNRIARYGGQARDTWTRPIERHQPRHPCSYSATGSHRSFAGQAASRHRQAAA